MIRYHLLLMQWNKITVLRTQRWYVSETGFWFFFLQWTQRYTNIYKWWSLIFWHCLVSAFKQCAIVELPSCNAENRKFIVFYDLLQAPSHKYDGHGSHVTNVCFTHSDSHLLSMGGKDTCILQWRVRGGDVSDSMERLASASSISASSPEPATS